MVYSIRAASIQFENAGESTKSLNEGKIKPANMLKIKTSQSNIAGLFCFMPLHCIGIIEIFITKNLFLPGIQLPYNL